MTGNPRRLDEWLRHAARLHPSEIDLGLERIAEVIGKLDLKPPPGRVVTVGGTNGKGSTAALIDAALRLRGGLRTAMYLSPYLQDFGERVQIGGSHADPESLSREFERVEAARGDIRLTEFEFLTLAAFSLFDREGCEVWVLEVGLGGRLDAVNAIDPDVSVITRIAMDHQDWLGNTLDSVAAEKAGILRAGRPAFYGAGLAPAPIAARAAELEAPLYQAGADFDFERRGERWDWRGRNVRRTGLPVADPANAAELPNASLAFAVLETLNADWVPGVGDYSAILTAGRLPGRFERMEFAGAEWVLDVAHNPDAGACLAKSLSALPPRPSIWVLGMHGDKDVAGFMQALPLNSDDEVIVTRAEWPKACSPEELARAVAARPHAKLMRCDSVAEACGQAAELAGIGHRVVVTGSFNTAGPARTWLLGRS
ncbi:MAG: bifunctional folylpolyglutamate synthase/dihydrofolate synthase [Gammaproteobacteria bacterium]|nr:bifunctional folylpolyglutamate synthase/dihydrofolate synthase [Chromatiales bacterium]MYE49040.1 bifunctional folylpolyglutamate synthase/dihydrofolate synthase [Gammaproteobacteria bacterium]